MEVKSLIDKTNAMLEEKGIKPIEMNDVVRDRLGLPEGEEYTGTEDKEKRP